MSHSRPEQHHHSPPVSVTWLRVRLGSAQELRPDSSPRARVGPTTLVGGPGLQASPEDRAKAPRQEGSEMNSGARPAIRAPALRIPGESETPER